MFDFMYDFCASSGSNLKNVVAKPLFLMYSILRNKFVTGKEQEYIPRQLNNI